MFWETGAIADQVTDHRHYVFRTVATGSMLGQQIAAFTSTVLLLRDHLQPVSASARAEAQREGISHLITVAYNHYTVAYNHYTVDACDLAKQVKAAHPDYVWAISYLTDSISILQALAAHQVHLASGGGASVLHLRWLSAGSDWVARRQAAFATDKPDGGIAPNRRLPRPSRSWSKRRLRTTGRSARRWTPANGRIRRWMDDPVH